MRSKFVQEVLAAAASRGEELSEQELAKRVESLRKAHYTRIGLISAINRRKRAEAKREASSP